VPTPIGNMGDLSPRAQETLAIVDTLACEDTRVTAKLLQKVGIEGKQLLSYRDANEQQLAPDLARRIASGETVALVCDAGTPTLSDPGFRLVRECQRQSLSVIPLPGPFAAGVALSASGLPTDAFLFVGFLPPKSSARKTFLEKHRDFPHTIILYESVHRIQKLAEEMLEILGAERTVSIAREMTKLHETILTGTTQAVRDHVASRTPKGEYVVLIAPASYTL